MQLLKLWDIQCWDGGERHNSRYLVSDKSIGDKWLQHHKHDIIWEKEIIILESWDELENYRNGKVREAALAKLTDIEKKVLGLA